jgi:hypothetical protein
MDSIDLCSDASYHPQTKIAVCGYLHDNQIISQIVTQTKNIDAEIIAFQMAVQFAQEKKYPLDRCRFLVDCQKVMSIGLEHGYNMVKIKGHEPSSQRCPLGLQFSKLDRALRKSLRLLLKNQ